MKKSLLTFFAVFMAATLIAQESKFNEGDKVLNLGIGFGSTLYAGRYYTASIPPVSASLEFAFMDNLLDVENLNLGLGGYVGFASYKYEVNWFGGSWGWEYTSIIVGARGALHYPLIDNFDTYSGLMLGYNIVSSKSFGTGGTGSASSGGIASAWYVGGRYYFTENLAGMIELGYGIAYLNLGVSLKF